MDDDLDEWSTRHMPQTLQVSDGLLLPVLGSPLPVGSDCGITTECDDGLTCESVEGNRRCRDVCGPECPGGLACGPVAEFTDGAPFRFCWPL